MTTIVGDLMSEDTQRRLERMEREQLRQGDLLTQLLKITAATNSKMDDMAVISSKLANGQDRQERYRNSYRLVHIEQESLLNDLRRLR